MMLLPIAWLWIGAGVCLGVRKRLPRVSWGAAVAGVFLAWLSMLAVFPWRGAALEFSVWEPAAVFDARMGIVLDVPGWDAGFAALTLLLAILLTSVARPGPGSAGLRAVILGYTSLGLLTMWSGTFLTLVVLWVMLDLGAFVYVIRLAPDAATARQGVRHLGVEALGEMLVVGAAVVGASAGAVAMGDESLPDAAVFLLAGGVLLRLGLLPLQFSWTSHAQIRRGLGTMLRLVPPATGLVVLSRQFGGGVPEPLRVWLIVAGGLGAVAAGVRWLFHRDAGEDWPYLLLGVCGVGTAVAGAYAGSSAAALTSCAILLLLCGGLVSITAVHAPHHRIVLILAALALAGAPFTAGGVLAGALVKSLARDPRLVAAATAVVGMALVGGGTLRSAWQPTTEWSASDRTTRALYAAGLWLPCAALVFLWPWRAGLASLPQVALFALAAAIGGVMVWRIPRPSVAVSGRWQRWTAWIDPRPLYLLGNGMYQVLLRAVRGIDGLVEGESSMLWVLVLVLMIALALGAGSV